MSKGFQDAVWNGLDTRRYNLDNMPEYTPPEDVGYIKSIGQNVLSGIESTLGGAGMFVGANMASGSPDYSKGGMMGQASNVGRDFGAELMNESQYLLNDASERQANYGASAMNWGGLGDAITNPDYWLSPRGLTADVAQGIGSSLPTLVAGGIGGRVASPLLSAIASGVGKQALKEGAASAAGKALSYMGGFGVGGGASEAISDAGSNYNDILQNLQGKVNPDGTSMYDEQGAMTEATRRMNDLGLSEMPYLMASNALTGGMVAGKMSKLLGQDSKSIGRRALANVFGAGADMTGEGFTEVAQTTLANDAMDKPSGNMWNPREWDEAQSDSFRGGFMGSLLPAAGGGAYHTVFGGNETPNVEQIAPQANNNLFGAGTAEISTQGADIDEQVAHLKDGYQSVIPQVAGVLVNDFGIEGAQISSGFRTREHNKEVGGAENSYHVGDGEHGDALDIVLPDGTSAETAEAIKQRFENSGVFDEVLFHDAGSGYHLHLGGLKTDNIGNSYGSYSGNADVDSAINEMAEKYNLDPALLAAMAEQESGFNQSAQSETGAMGIMQLMPGTAEGLGVDPSDLRGNLEGGAKYLRQMLDKYDGDVEKALAAYNAGPGSLDSVNGDISKLSGETQKYVPSVMERYNKFKNKVGGGISSSGNILDWDSTNEDFSKLDFFPKDGEQSQGTANEFLENLAKLEESDDQATKEKGRQAQDILQQYGDDTEKLTEKAKELGYQQTVNPAEVHGRIPMRRIVSTALDKGQVTFATKKAADIFASSPIGQTMERQGKTFKVTDNFKMNEQVNAISQQVYSSNTVKNKTVSNGVTPDVASQENNANKPLTAQEVNSLNEVFQSMPPTLKERIQKMMAGKKYDHVRATMQKFINNPAYSPLSTQEVDSLNKALQTMPEELRSQIQGMMANEQYDDVRAAIQKYVNNPANKLQSSQAEQAGNVLNSLLNIPEAMSSSTGTRIDGNKVRSYIESGNLPMMNRAINAMSQNLREHGIEPQFSTRVNENQLNSQERAPEDAQQLAENNGVTEDSSRARQPEYNGEESHEKDVKKEESTKGQTKPQNNDNENPNASNEPMRKELIEQAAANEDTWVNSKKSELHLEDDNDTVVKLTPQELKYYQDLARKGVVAKPELYEESQEDVGEMDDNVEMSKEQKQLYDESSDDRDMPSVEDEAEPTADEPRTKYSREKSPVDEKNNQQENVTIEFAADTPAAQKVFDEQLTDEVKRDLRNTIAQQMTDTIEDFEALSDEVKMDRAFADLPIVRTMRVVYQTNTIQDSENNKSKLAARYEYARRCFLYDERVPNGISRPATSNEQQKRMVGNQQKDGTQFNGSPKKQRLRENDGSGTVIPSLGEYKFIKKQFDKLVDDKLKHSSRDKSAFSIEPINPHSAEFLKENGNSNTELDRLPKVPIAKLRQSEQKIVRFGKAIGVPVHFVESSDTTNRGVFTHNGEIFINRKAKVPAHSIFVHEFVHWLKASPENAGAYDVLHACLENSSGLFNEARINKYRNKIFDGEKMTDEEIVEEIICDAMTQTESAEKLMRAVNNVDGGLVTRIAGCLKAMWDKFCEYMNFKQHKMSNEQHLPNELSVAEFQRADIAFNKILMNLKNDNGEPVFHRVGTELLLRDTNAKPVDTYQIKPISYTYAVAYSKENKDKEPIDRNNNQQDNVIVEFAGDKREAQQVFNKHLTQGLKDLTRQTIEKEITDNIKDFEKLADPVELDKAMNDLPAMKRMRQWFQQKDMQSKPAYMDRLAARYEYARRCFLNDSRIRDRFIRPAGRYNQQERISETISSGISRVKRTEHEGSLQQSDGRGTVAPTVGEYKFIKNHFDKLVDKLTNSVPKHSKESAFLMPENGKPYTMSYYHNTQPSPKMAGDMFAQSIEPAGEYIAHDTMNGSNQIPGFEYGKISFKSPLVLEHKSTGHGGWKTDLSNMFGGKKGKALSNAIKKAGHDGIITIDSKTGEILETVNLAGNKNNGNKYSRGVDLSPSTDGVAIAARANNNLVANMKGLAKKVNAKFNPFHHEELENLRIQKRDKEKDLNLIEYQFVSPTRESKKYKAIQPFVMKGKQAMAKQEKLRFEFNEGMNEVDKLLGWREGFHRNDSKFKERKEALNEILLKGDLEGKEFTNEELIKAGYDAETIKGYRKMRALLDKAWKLANDTKSRIKYQSITSSTLRRAEADFADLKDKNPFAEIISKVHNPDGTVTINYKAPHVRRVAKQTVLPSELENLRKNKDVHIVETTQSLKGTTQVTYYQREAGMGKIKGYIPHIFHGWYVCKVDEDGKAIVDEDGNVAMDNIMTTANSLSEAAKLGRELAKANPNANYRVVPQTFSAPGAQEQAIVMGDFDYAKIVGKVADSMSMSITDAQAMLDNTVKMKNRGRFYGYAMQRKGFKGFEQNVYLATMKYFNQTARYAAMDSFKRDSISMYNRIFGAFDDENVTKRSAMAKWTKQYIYDVNGTPTWIEKFLNNTLHSWGFGEERAGGRPVLWFQQKIMTYPMTILKLGVFNPSSALLNLTQLFNLYGAMGEKVLSPQAYQRLLHKGFADTFRAMSNKDSELGKLLWKDLGLDYQIGMDVASGYSNAEVNNLASLRGFAGRLAGKSMYLFRQSDAFARGVTLLTAYNKALDEGKSKAEAIEYAKEINDKVNFDYSVADEPTIFRALGPISKVFLQFKKYPVKQLELFQDFYLDGRKLGLNRKQAALRTLKYMAPYMAMSGMMGIPFISLAGGLLSALVATATGDDDWDWEKKIKQYMITEFGEDSPITQWWLYGAGSFIGLNLGSRVGIGDFLGPDSYNSADGLLGLAVNQTTLGSTIQQVSKQLSYRNYAEALKAINPTMGNIALAYKGEVRTTRGRMKYQYQNMAERMWRAIGFTPLNETLAGDLASNEYAEKQEQTKAKQEAVDDFLANPSSENTARLNELGVTPKTLENESARRTMNRHQLNELAKEKEAAKKKKKPKTYSASDYLKAVQ